MTDPNDLRKIETWLRENKAGVWMAEVCEDAADDIERLQRSVTDWQLEADVHRKRASAAIAEIARLRLTDAEREAIEWAAIRSDADAQMIGGEFYAAARNMRARSATLRELLERLK